MEKTEFGALKSVTAQKSGYEKPEMKALVFGDKDVVLGESGESSTDVVLPDVPLT